MSEDKKFIAWYITTSQMIFLFDGREVQHCLVEKDNDSESDSLDSIEVDVQSGDSAGLLWLDMRRGYPGGYYQLPDMTIEEARAELVFRNNFEDQNFMAIYALDDDLDVEARAKSASILNEELEKKDHRLLDELSKRFNEKYVNAMKEAGCDFDGAVKICCDYNYDSALKFFESVV